MIPMSDAKSKSFTAVLRYDEKKIIIGDKYTYVILYAE